MVKATDVEIARSVGLKVDELNRLAEDNNSIAADYLLKTTLEDIITLKFKNNKTREKYITISTIGGTL